ncbi:ATP-grasp ribosomal peptide maturase [Streptomyces lunaelactis]|uniref:ATP-grasp ribosomal peptide maturase n=2 Tax=Streptomyces lunaelactis TaxID=1535768 RepID=UPI0015851C13|nr:ATP-grasp ribosomal peptide maturase [Streptomyces lunaelactis]NUK05722.1 ATP-grasp ribosomal peptide maturase [Streptomyces lunaelactis]NUK20155.1 ATP-grasp ribosomal peptide maturase [Streptomyces lunaelactis]NUK26720.1 ATP-grasp ribosomal peptide maturase [Streptomyces lunaelactis]NUK38691.1 ATP-grasp ribosomal peptide maturase [Streptomyces lunaelactis]NUK40462.1 ATP-grasp ribosomal peptide maturase [Streptomyces lunaelactis]
MTVLILTCRQDVTTDMVVASLHERGIPLVRFDPADLPGEASMSAEFISGDFRGYLSYDGRLLSMSGLRSIWVRRPGEPAAHAAEPSEWLTAESGQALYGMLNSTTARWMNHPCVAAQARCKPWQLRVAHRSGFAVPPTLITTFPRVARQFAAQYREIVVKSASGPPRSDPPITLPTTRIGPETDFADVAAAPTLLQQYIPKRADIRLTSVGGRLFAARKVSESGQVDGRYGETGHAWESVEVPDRIGRAVHEFTGIAGLAYGAFDFAEDAEGVWWFLECNQGGQFGFVELETGQPIAEAVASWLAYTAA